MQEKFQNELLADEQILWMGQANRSMHFTKQDSLLIPASLFLGRFSIEWVRGFMPALFLTPEASFPLVFILIMALFALISLLTCAVTLYFIFGRFILKSYRKKKTYYAVTNKRAILVSEAFAQKVKSHFFDTSVMLRKYKAANGFGTLKFEKVNFRLDGMGNTGLDLFFDDGSVNFYDIPEVDDVYKLVNELIQSSFKS